MSTTSNWTQIGNKMILGHPARADGPRFDQGCWGLGKPIGLNARPTWPAGAVVLGAEVSHNGPGLIAGEADPAVDVEEVGAEGLHVEAVVVEGGEAEDAWLGDVGVDPGAYLEVAEAAGIVAGLVDDADGGNAYGGQEEAQVGDGHALTPGARDDHVQVGDGGQDGVEVADVARVELPGALPAAAGLAELLGALKATVFGEEPAGAVEDAVEVEEQDALHRMSLRRSSQVRSPSAFDAAMAAAISGRLLLASMRFNIFRISFFLWRLFMPDRCG